jgi:hypothetical protein
MSRGERQLPLICASRAASLFIGRLLPLAKRSLPSCECVMATIDGVRTFELSDKECRSPLSAWR